MLLIDMLLNGFGWAGGAGDSRDGPARAAWPTRRTSCDRSITDRATSAVCWIPTRLESSPRT